MRYTDLIGTQADYIQHASIKPISYPCPQCETTGKRKGSVSKVEMVTPMALIYNVLFPSISTFETPPTRGALETPDGKPAQAETDIMGVARQAATLAAAGFVEELKAEGEEEGEDECNKRFGGAQEGKVGRLIAEVDGDRTVVTYRFGSVSHVSSPGQMPLVRMRHGVGNVCG
jgi:hypothetical protein